MKKSTSMLALVGAASLALAACAEDTTTEETSNDTSAAEETSAEEEDTTEDDGASEEETGAEEEAGIDYSSIDGSDYTACLVSDAGGWDDKSFNESAFNGLQDAVDMMGVQTQTRESSAEGDFQPNVDALVGEGCNLIIGVGFLLEPATHTGAENNPDINFALVDASYSDADGNEVVLENGRPLLFNTAEAAYLAGYVAAATSQTGIVATFGGLPIPSVQVFMDGFVDGVAAYNEAKGANVQVLGWDKESQTGSFSNSFDDQAQGRSLAQGFIAQGADVIMPVAGPVGLGAASAAQEAGEVYIVGVDSDWYESASEFSSIILTSVLKDIDASVLDTIAAGIQGEFSAEPYIGTLENGGVGIAPFHDLESIVPAETAGEVEELKNQIISGDIVVESPNTP